MRSAALHMPQKQLTRAPPITSSYWSSGVAMHGTTFSGRPSEDHTRSQRQNRNIWQRY